MKPGDRVRATLGESTIVGEVLRPGGPWVEMRADGAEDTNSFATPPWTVEVLAPPVPAWMLEPGAVCKDMDGVAWQRGWHGDAWYAGSATRTTADLIAQGTRLVPVPVVPGDVLEAARRLPQAFCPDSGLVARWVLDLAGQA